MKGYLLRFAIPGQDQGVPVESGQLRIVADPWQGFTPGIVRTVVSPDGLEVTNITTMFHALHSGRIVRRGRIVKALFLAAFAMWSVTGMTLAASNVNMRRISTMMFMMDIKVRPGKKQEFFNALGSFAKKLDFRMELIEFPPAGEGCIGVTMVGDELVFDGISESGGPNGVCDPLSYQVSIDTNFYKGVTLTGHDDEIRAVARKAADDFKAEVEQSATVVVRQQSN